MAVNINNTTPAASAGNTLVTWQKDSSGNASAQFRTPVDAATQAANKVLAGPATGSAATPAFRLLVAADIPSIAESQVTSLVSDLAAKAPLASPALTGTPTAPTPSTADNSTKIATTAYVQAQGYGTGGGSAQFPGQVAVTTPPTSGWSTLSPAGNTAPTLNTAGTGYLKLTFGSASDWGYALRAVPSTPYTVTMHVTFMLAGSSQLVGFGFADNTNFGRFASFVGDGTVVIQNENANGTFFNSSAVTLRGFGCGIWFQFSDDGSSTRKISISGDGRVFTDLVSEGRTTNITATKLLLGVYNAGMIIDSWQ